MKRLFAFFISFLAATNSFGAIYCNGTVKAVYKWNSMTSLSIQIQMADGTITNWINMPTKSDEAMAIVAITTGKHVDLYWADADVTVCKNGWVDNRVLSGYMMVTN